MKVAVKLFASLGGKGGTRDQEVEVKEGAGIRDLFEAMDLEITRARAIFVNARHARPDETLSDGDRVDVFPAIGGG